MTVKSGRLTGEASDSVAGVRPNILVIETDQQRPDTIGAYGQRLEVTPHLDALADQGVVFENAFTVQPVCGPSRAALQTGRMPTAIGCWRNGLGLEPDSPTLASRLGELGYQTGYIGKWHLASDHGPGRRGSRTLRYEKRPVPPERRGGYRDAWVASDALELTSGPFDGRMFDEDGDVHRLEGWRVDAVTDVAIDRLRAFDRSRPFLLFVSHLEPHHQNDRFRTIAPPGEARRFRGHDVPGDLTGTLGDWRWNHPAALACAHSIDRNLGRMLDELTELGARRNTIVVFTSDHGSHYRTRNLEYKRSCHDASVRVPLVIAGPGFETGRRDPGLVSHLDLVPSLVHAAGGDHGDLDGKVLQDPSTSRDEILIQISEDHLGRVLRTDRYTLAARAPGPGRIAGMTRPGSARYRLTHLYDNELDPFQRRNLIAEPSRRATVAELTERLVRLIEVEEGDRPRLDHRAPT